MSGLIGKTLVVLAGLAGVAQAAPEVRDEDERSTYVELKLGNYVPAIDEEFDIPAGQVGPYEEIFGNGGELMFVLGFERHLLTGYGTLSAGGELGYWSVEGEGISATATDTTEIQILPLAAQLTYRLDPWQDYVPVVLMGRLGLDYYAWRILDGAGDTARFSSGEEASGGTWGWHAGFGVNLLLDYFSPAMASDFNRDAGVNNSYLTFEYRLSQVDDFGSGDSLHLGDSALFFGLALDM